MAAFYNENHPYAAAWLRNLIVAGHIAPGVVDERSIVELGPDELRGYTQCHFFAGIGVWSHALRLAGIPDSRSVWTGSCPCQPFSAAGKGKGHEDERHLWPAWQRLIRECRPPAVLGEQVASADGLGWLDVVLSDLEAADYAVAAADLSAAGFGAPHIRQRLFFVAHAVGSPTGARHARLDDGAVEPERSSDARLMAHAERGTAERRRLDVGSAAGGAEGEARQRQWLRAEFGAGGDAGLVGNANDTRQEGHGRHVAEHDPQGREAARRHDPPTGFWSDCDWLPCRDGKARPVESRSQPLADGVAARMGYVRSGEGWTLFPLQHGAENRVGRLRGYGNAIVAPVAAGFISAAMPDLWQ